MTKIEQLIKEENRHRRLGQAHEEKSNYHWNKANEIFLEIVAEAENERELDCSNSSSSMGV